MQSRTGREGSRVCGTQPSIERRGTGAGGQPGTPAPREVRLVHVAARDGLEHCVDALEESPRLVLLDLETQVDGCFTLSSAELVEVRGELRVEQVHCP